MTTGSDRVAAANGDPDATRRLTAVDLLALGSPPPRPVPPSARKPGRYTPPDPITRARKAARRTARTQRQRGRK